MNKLLARKIEETWGARLKFQHDDMIVSTTTIEDSTFIANLQLHKKNK